MWWLIFIITALLFFTALNVAPMCMDLQRKNSWYKVCSRNMGALGMLASVALFTMVIIASYGYARR